MTQPSSEHQPPKPGPTERDAYNIVTDTVSGVNFRHWDNMFQAAVSTVCTALGIPTGWLIAYLQSGDQLAGILLGLFFGLIAGLLGSGIFLMVFRAVRHIRGKHE